jgi:hypothetical protein
MRQKERYQNFLAEEEAAKAAKTAPLIEELQTTTRALAAKRRDLCVERWSMPLDAIGEIGVQDPGMWDDLGLPTSDVADTEENGREIARQFWAFIDSITARTGYTLNSSGRSRFASYIQVQAFNKVAITQDSLAVMFQRFLDLGIWESQNELGYDASLKTAVEPEPEPEAPRELTLADLEAMPSDTREQRARQKDAVVELAVNQQIPLAQEWMASLANNFGFHITDEQWKWCTQAFKKNNLSYLDRRSYDIVRKAAVAQGIFPESCLTADDRILKEMDDLDLSGLSTIARIAAARRIARGR